MPTVIRLMAMDSAAFRRLCVETGHVVLDMDGCEQPPSGGCVLKPPSLPKTVSSSSAAFRRLCVETLVRLRLRPFDLQPPSGGCVLKLDNNYHQIYRYSQPPSGGCVLKQRKERLMTPEQVQPPSGGCVLKQINHCHRITVFTTAAFRRLCVETATAASASP